MRAGLPVRIQNLWRMRQFYELYRDDRKLSPLVREIAWTHNVIIMMRCAGRLEREFYIRMTRKFGWSKNVLAMQIDGQGRPHARHAFARGRHGRHSANLPA